MEVEFRISLPIEIAITLAAPSQKNKIKSGGQKINTGKILNTRHEYTLSYS
jgi:hypothetical protein